MKFVTKGPPPRDHNVWLRQFPQTSGIWGACKFVFDPDAMDYDWLVVNDDLPCKDHERFSTRKEHLRCKRENTLLVTTEPITVKGYSKPFLEQFGHVLSSQEPEFIRHPNAIFSQAGLHWFYGVGRNSFITYDQMKAARPPVKAQLISTVCSSKQQKHTLHNLRYAFTMKIKAAMPELDHFGHGVKLIDDKAEALDPYRYHIAIENHICAHHWTEKLADPFLGFCLPIYCGCPNVAEYFPQESYIPIDIFDFNQSLDTIESAIAGNEYEKRLPAIIEARRLVLDEYNLFAVLARIIESQHAPSFRPATSREMILSRRGSRKRHPLHHLGEQIRRLAKSR
ncbi:MAG: glycosyltransferase family 10 domain-containing protein [Thiobacillus sp.]